MFTSCCGGSQLRGGADREVRQQRGALSSFSRKGPRPAGDVSFCTQSDPPGPALCFSSRADAAAEAL